jgi:hypothetical protein
MADIFISYTQKDRAAAELLAEELERHGYSVWYDQGLASGDVWRNRITSEIGQARALAVIWTEASANSHFVQQEVDEAQGLEKPIISLRKKGFSPSQIPIGFRHLQTNLASDFQSILALLQHNEVQPSPVTTTTQHAASHSPKAVFMRAFPEVTLIDRSATKEAKTLIAQLASVGRLIRVCGPTRSGKTVMIRQALGDYDPIYVPGGVTHDRESFLEHLALSLGLEGPASEVRVFNAVVRSHRPIVIDDYHRIPTSPRHAILRRAQSFLDQDISLILISWTDIDQETIERDPGLGGRSEPPITMSLWREAELKEIGRRGFEQGLNIEVDAETVSELARHSYRNPYMMQQHCCMLAEKLEISTRLPAREKRRVEQDLLKQVFIEACAQTKRNFAPMIEPPGRARDVQLINDHWTTIEGLIALSIRRLDPIHAMTPGTMAANMKPLAKDPSWISGPNVENAVRDFMTRLERSPHRTTALEFSNSKLHIHPFIKRYLIWDFARAKGFEPGEAP